MRFCNINRCNYSFDRYVCNLREYALEKSEEAIKIGHSRYEHMQHWAQGTERRQRQIQQSGQHYITCTRHDIADKLLIKR
jgi:hypothetical protein